MRLVQMSAFSELLKVVLNRDLQVLLRLQSMAL